MSAGPIGNQTTIAVSRVEEIPLRAMGTDADLKAAFYACFNRLAALAALIVFSPLMLVIAALLSREGGPILFGHFRVGAGGRLFRCWKFRTMVPDAEARLAKLLETDPQARAEWERDQKLTRDPRVTALGRFLRASSLDELPQFFNVLAGDMALVGPRPVTVEELSRYGTARWAYMSVLPGVTGLWQVSGRNKLSYEQRVALDKQYVDNRSFLLDLSILARTLGVVITRHGAC